MYIIIRIKLDITWLMSATKNPGRIFISAGIFSIKDLTLFQCL